ncbi:hypothetical protein EDD18DRAFT_1112655 [Armillaria luteobubalina]|uniref:Uncharacterized protein n=1 Tax=Armillaria luteobubalina TaxID=153913 RepID=A0AA39PEK5_9AGAR|nr:hypothetical protein EDD18DRAFT_1112655 [Armillaria luteobubalina]
MAVQAGYPLSYRLAAVLDLFILATNDIGGENVIHQIVALLNVAKPYDLRINCVVFDFVQPPLLDLLSVKSLKVDIPVVGEDNLQHTNDCLKRLKKVSEVASTLNLSYTFSLNTKDYDVAQI